MPVFSQAPPGGTGSGFAQRLTTARFCPKRAADDFSAGIMWYNIPSMTNFDCCPYCYNTHIARAPPALARAWVPNETQPPESLTYCDFHFPRTVQMWYHAANSNDLSIFTSYVQRLANVFGCPGKEGTTPQQGLRWYTLAANRTSPGSAEAVDGFVVCERCYATIVAATPYSDKFEPFQRIQGPQEVWSCDLATATIEHAFGQGAAHDPRARAPWGDILNTIRVRFAVKPCVGSEGTADPSCSWWALQPADTRGGYKLDDFIVCDEHYHDDIVATGRSREFVPVLGPPAPGTKRICDFTSHSISTAWRMATNAGMPSVVFRDAVSACFSSPACVPEGMADSVWYGLRTSHNQTVPNIDVCQSCFFGYIRPFGPSFEQLFVSKGRTPEQKICDFCIRLARAPTYLRKLLKAGISGDTSVLVDHMVAHSTIPMCPTRNAANDGRKWFGTEEFLVCEECQYDIIRPSSYPYPIPQRNPRMDERCSLWPADIRALWAQASLSPQHDLTPVLNKAKEQQAAFAKHDQFGLMMAQNRFAQATTFANAMNRVVRF